MKKVEVSISPSIIWYTLITLIIIFMVVYLKSLVILVYLSFILATALHPIATRLQRRFKLNRPISILLSLVSLITVVLFIVGLVVPPLVRQLFSLVNLIDIPIIQQQLRSFDLNLEQVSSLADSVGASVGVLANVITSAFSSIFSIFALLVLAYYMTLEKPELHHKAYWFTKDEKRIKQVEEFVNSLDAQLGGWVRGQVILMFTIGLLTYAGLSLLSIPYALPLALLAGLMEIVPNLGPTISAIPAIFIAYVTHGPMVALAVFILGLVIQQLENSFIVPKVMRKNANVNPLISIISVLVGFQLAGPLGALLSIPSYIIARSIYASFFRHRIGKITG